MFLCYRSVAFLDILPNAVQQTKYIYIEHRANSHEKHNSYV